MNDISVWLAGQGLSVGDLNAETVAHYVVVRKQVRSNLRSPRALVALLRFLRGLGATPLPAVVVPAGAEEVLAARFGQYLSAQKGLAAATVRSYLSQVAPFLAWHARQPGARWESLTSGGVERFVAGRAAGQRPRSVQVGLNALRALLRWMWLEGLAPSGLADAIGPVAAKASTALPKALTSAQVSDLRIGLSGDGVARCRDEAMLALMWRMGLCCRGRRPPCLAGETGPRRAPASEIRRERAVAALRETSLRQAAGVRRGSIRFNPLNGYVAQRLLFERDLRRKPVSLFWFRLIWPLLWQRRRPMPLVSAEGIYCFYSRELIEALASMIGDRRCLEIAAGDGTLSRFLADRGVRIVATDEHSWSHRLRLPRSVLRQDARTALRLHRPQAWSPRQCTRRLEKACVSGRQGRHPSARACCGVRRAGTRRPRRSMSRAPKGRDSGSIVDSPDRCVTVRVARRCCGGEDDRIVRSHKR